MMKLSEEQKEKGLKIFLAANPVINDQIEALTKADAKAMCTTIARHKEQEAMKALRKVARVLGIDARELFLSCIADTADEFRELLASK